ncbi:hypothetical protein PHJA_001050200 [Phtheirospermum japonicum]|uniref:DUF632 domain-containing protein n=1 Tax=Phtheirospermum japonicum TaxID=374723 RepID=A0A830C0T0_9LAMI|nr:hypothetical protein PHJA_001050200 [Phtheirospermum japonicum]
MGACVASRLQQEEEVVSICRERKHQIKLAVEKRYALADAHYKYFQSLFGVSAAINLFVARHSPNPSPFYITLPPPTTTKETLVSNPLFLKQNPSEPTKQALAPAAESSCTSSRSSSLSSENECVEEHEENKKEEKICGYFYMDMPQTQNIIASPQRDFGWDFFNPFDNVTMTSARPEMVSFYNNRNISEEDLRAVREEEGIPELEDENEEERNDFVGKERVFDLEERENGVEAVKRVDSAKMSLGGEQMQKGLTVIDTPVRGRELLEALKDIEDHFIRAYDSGKDVSRMLECNRVHLQSNLEEIKENSTKLMQAITWRSASSRSTSCKSLVSGSKSSSTWTEFSNDLFDDYGGMASGSHSLTLERLMEIVSGEFMSGNAISLEIKMMTRAWKVILESHEIQSKIIFEVKTFTCPSYSKFCNESHRLATLQLETELVNWRSCFKEYVMAQRGYIEALYKWLSKFVAPEVEYYSRGKNSSPPCRSSGPRLLAVCHDWLDFMNNLPDKSVSFAIKSCAKDVRALWAQQGEEHMQKRKVDSLSKDLDKKISAFQKAENRMFELRLTDKNNAGPEMENRAESLAEGKDMLDNFRRKVELEKEKHLSCMQETERITLNGFQTGFCRVFESMTEYSREALKMYNELSAIENGGKTCIEGSHVENGSR